MHRLSRIAAQECRRVVGLISGTSADGIDAALVELSGWGTGTRFRVLEFRTVALPDGLRAEVLALCDSAALVEQLCRVNFALGEAFAQAALQVIEAAGLLPGQVALIGSHGQTVRHLPGGIPPSTLQIGEPAVIAARTGIVTIADFRPADMALGGEGAPLVPLVDHLLFTHPRQSRLLLNIGGIANVTLLPAGGAAEKVRAFDLGPGNALLDAAVSHFSGGRACCDWDGAQAARGRVDEGLLAALMQHPFLRRSPPKSTGREAFGAAFFRALLGRTALPADDWLATLTAFTARAIAAGIRRFVPEAAREMWVGGGGVHNVHLMGLLRRELPGLQIDSVSALGVDPDAREALSFAVLANQTLMDRPGNLPSATGARRPAVLGKIVLP